ALGHHRHVGKAPGRRVTDAETAGADLGADLAHLVAVRVHLGAGLMDAFQGRAGKLELAARLEAHGRQALRKPDDVVAFADRFPAEALHAFEKRADAGRALIGKRLVILQRVNKFFVLGADAPFALRLRAGRDIGDQIGEGTDRARGGLRNRHARIPLGQYALAQL